MFHDPDFDADRDERRNSPGVGRVVFVVLLIAAALYGGRRFLDDRAAVAADRAAGRKPTLLMFTADWCGPCQGFKARVLADDRVVARVHQSFAFQYVDLTKWQGQPADTATRYGVRAIPTLVLVTSKGKEIDRYAGPHDPTQFANWLDRHAR